MPFRKIVAIYIFSYHTLSALFFNRYYKNQYFVQTIGQLVINKWSNILKLTLLQTMLHIFSIEFLLDQVIFLRTHDPPVRLCEITKAIVPKNVVVKLVAEKIILY